MASGTDQLERLVLSGELFNGASRSSSPSRSPSPDAQSAKWPSEDFDDAEYERTTSYISNSHRVAPEVHADAPSAASSGPGRTGVKGVIRDRDEAVALARNQRNRDVEEMNRAMERANLGGKTWAEEEREKRWQDILEGNAGLSPEALFAMGMSGSGMDKMMGDGAKKGRFGHLREVGMRGYVSAVEDEDRDVWVVVHIYDPSLDRCDRLDDTLVHLARSHPSTKFVRCRATAIGFASTTPTTSRTTTSRTHRPTRSIHSSFLTNDDGFGDGEEDDEEAEGDADEDNVDTDMLPTMLVYRAGELVHNWVRVDWEAGKAGVEELLQRHHIIQPLRVGSDNLGLPTDEEEEELDLIGSED